MTLGEKIQDLRKARGWTQEQLAERISVSRQALSRWELGAAVPDTENVLQISRLFGVSTDYLLHNEYGNDGDVPAAQTSGAALTAKHKSLAWIVTGGILAGLSALGLLILGILGTAVFPVRYGISEVNGSEQVYTGLHGFLLGYDLVWLFLLLCALLAAGLAILLWRWLSVRHGDKSSSGRA